MTEADAIEAQRCFHHESREAVGRCPECGRTFCRECLTEHDDRVLCSSCLKRLDQSAAAAPRRRRSLVPALQVVAGFILLWLSFYALGNFLLTIPAAVHDGTLFTDDGSSP